MGNGNLANSLQFVRFQVINFDSARGGVSVITEKAEVTISHLLIQKADLADSGTYTCAPSNANPLSVRVHILNGIVSNYYLIAMNV